MCGNNHAIPLIVVEVLRVPRYSIAASSLNVTHSFKATDNDIEYGSHGTTQPGLLGLAAVSG